MFRKPVKAALFDMDGLLLDSEAVYIKAMQAAARTFDLEMPLAFCHSMVGIPRAECNVMIQERYGEGFDLEAFRGVYSANVRQVMEERVPIKPGVVEAARLPRRARHPLRRRHLGPARHRGEPSRPGGPDQALRHRDDARRRRARQALPGHLSRGRPPHRRRAPRTASPSRIRHPASQPPMPPARWRSWCPTSCSRPTRPARNACTSRPTFMPSCGCCRRPCRSAPAMRIALVKDRGSYRAVTLLKRAIKGNSHFPLPG